MATVAKRRQKIDMPKSIKNKFAAALCMLLVGAIMMVSSSYAWFTLSTAPEVKGITTNVGANGNLEIVLLNGDAIMSTADDLGVIVDIGQSMESRPRTEANVFWGNLVDLSDSAYGLSDIILAPAALNITDAGNGDKTVGKSILKVPSYGTDGRVLNVNNDTGLGYRTGGSFTVLFSDAARTGVSAIGSDAGVNARDLAYMNALSAVSSYMASARSAAQSSLVDNGQSLGSVLMNMALYEATFGPDDIAFFVDIIDDLRTANGYVLEAIKQAAFAYAISAANDDPELTDDGIETMRTNIANASNLADIETAAGLTLPAAIGTAYTQYQTTATNINAAEAAYNTLIGQNLSTYTEAQVRTVLDTVINKQYVTIAGITNPTSDDGGAILSAAGAAGGIPVVLGAGSGIYYDIAKSAGNLIVTNMTFDMDGNPVAGNMRTEVVNDEFTLADALTAVSEPGAAGGDNSLAMSDLFGYIIDLGFRTNAADSNLLLQNDETQRIYNSDDGSVTNIRTQGAGTYISFETADASKFSTDDVKALMSAVRIVFVTPVLGPDPDTGDTVITSYEIIHMAAPDDDTFTVSGNTVKAELGFYEYSAEIVNTNEVKVNLDREHKEEKNEEGHYVITDLEQNKAKKISVIVYLDGDEVDNTMVANAKTSMSGKLNLQFASDKPLVPMDVASLKKTAAESLQQAVDAIKADAKYTEAQNAAEPTEAQTALLTAVADAEAALAEANPAQEDILSAAQALKTAALAAGIAAETIGY